MVAPDDGLRIGATQLASTLVQQAHDELAAEGYPDLEIEQLSRAFLAERTEGTPGDFVQWVRDRRTLAGDGLEIDPMPAVPRAGRPRVAANR
jgi:hypothetical protein